MHEINKIKHALLPYHNISPKGLNQDKGSHKHYHKHNHVKDKLVPPEPDHNSLDFLFPLNQLSSYLPQS